MSTNTGANVIWYCFFHKTEVAVKHHVPAPGSLTSYCMIFNCATTTIDVLLYIYMNVWMYLYWIYERVGIGVFLHNLSHTPQPDRACVAL